MLILSFSGNAENSLTLKSLEVLEHHPDVTDAVEKVLVKPSAKMRLIPCEKVIESLDRRKTKA